jgi:uncharacterized protein (DUF2236 family)
VHATLLDSLPLTYEALVGPIAPAERDRYCEESAAVAIALGATPESVPRSHRAATDYIDQTISSGAIVVSDEARALADAVLRPSLRIVIGPVAEWNRLLTIGWLPPTLRQQYGFAWSDADASRLEGVTGWLKRMRRLTPRRVRLWPEAR